MEDKYAYLIEEMMGILREEVKGLGGEFDLADNPYGFCSVWIENDEEVWWDERQDAIRMDELTELCAMHATIQQTLKELEQ